jgi:hypothetical protein
MQDRYVGDVGDFGKYGLLWILSGMEGENRLSLGVVWYLYPNESHNADGKHIGYLRDADPAFRDCDSRLYDKLRALLFDDLGLIEVNRNLGAIESAEILPQGTVFYSLPLAYQGGLSFPSRLSLRREWFANATAKTESVDLVFLDPDNGIECVSVTRTNNKGPKYVFWDDLDAFVGRDQSLIVYHHLNRNGSHSSQVEAMRRSMNERFGHGFETSAIIYKRGSGRAYFIIASPQHKELLSQRLSKMRMSSWSRHFDFTHV